MNTCAIQRTLLKHVWAAVMLCASSNALAATIVNDVSRLNPVSVSQDKAYPAFAQIVTVKQIYDPDGIFMNKFYAAYQSTP